MDIHHHSCFDVKLDRNQNRFRLKLRYRSRKRSHTTGRTAYIIAASYMDWNNCLVVVYKIKDKEVGII